jgi:hypothetical protein
MYAAYRLPCAFCGIVKEEGVENQWHHVHHVCAEACTRDPSMAPSPLMPTGIFVQHRSVILLAASSGWLADVWLSCVDA